MAALESQTVPPPDVALSDVSGDRVGLTDLSEAWRLRDSSPASALLLAEMTEAAIATPDAWACCAVVRAFLLYRRGELQEALPLILDAVATRAETPLDVWHGRASNTAALIYSGLGLPEPAVEFLLAGQQQTLTMGDAETAFSCFHNMGVELGQMGDFDGAIDNFNRAEAYVDQGLNGHAFLALNRCDLYLEMGDICRALTTVEHGRQHWAESDSQARVFGLLVEARVALAGNDPDTAAQALQSIRAEFDESRSGIELTILEARLHLQRGELDRAEALLVAHEIGEGSNQVEDVYLAARLVQLHAELAESRGDYRRALSIVRTARDSEIRERRQTMSRVTTLIMNENTRQLHAKNKQLNDAVEELRLVHAELKEVAARDHLTGLHNRRYLADHVEDLVAHHQRYDRPLSLMVLDIDNFKSINDTYLHSTGDAVLKTIAELLQSQKRAGDVLCRLGGDEFVTMLPDTDIRGATMMARRLHAAVQEYAWSRLAEGLAVSVSIGATTATTGESLEDLLVAADRAMYRAKSAGKNQVHTGVGAINP